MLFPQGNVPFKKKPRAKKEPLPKKEKTISLEEALRVIQANGLSVSSPSGEEISMKQVETDELLGVKELPKKVQRRKAIAKEPEKTKEIVLTLNVSHSVNGKFYGPGRVVLSSEDGQIAGLLEAADRSFTNEHLRKTTLRTPECYLIAEATTPEGVRRNMAVPVSPSFFSSNLSDDQLNRVTTQLYGVTINPAFNFS